MHMIEFWIMRKDEDARKVAPEVGGAILRHRDNGKCLFCGDGHKIVAVIAFCWREPDADLYTAGICIDCEARHSDEQLAQKTQQEGSPIASHAYSVSSRRAIKWRSKDYSKRWASIRSRGQSGANSHPQGGNKPTLKHKQSKRSVQPAGRDTKLFQPYFMNCFNCASPGVSLQQ
jgi:hypothetical protein